MKKLFDMPEEVDEEKYSPKIKVPQYIPKAHKPLLGELCNDTKYVELVKEIKQSNVTEEEKDFLIKAATRHYKFNYAKIADYYAHADKEMQKLMEKSALVIIDINDAIANGYVKLTRELNDIIKEGEKLDGYDS